MKKKIILSTMVVLLIVIAVALKPVMARSSSPSQGTTGSPQIPVVQVGSQPSMPTVDIGYGNWNPWAEMEYMQDQANRMFHNNGFGSQVFSRAGNGNAFFSPAMDMEDTGSAYVIKLDLPGMERSAIKLQQEGHKIIVSGKRTSEHKQKNKADHYYWQERSMGAFSRVVTLPKNAEMAKINAAYKNGVLTVTIPKFPRSKHTTSLKRIKIN